MTSPDDPSAAEGARIPAGAVARGRVEPPRSKSHAIRALVVSALAEGTTGIGDMPDSEDVIRTVTALGALGIDLIGSPETVSVTGCAGRLPRSSAHLDLGGSGTAFRVLLAICALGDGPYELTGDASLLARPVGSVADAVRLLGVEVEGRDVGGALHPPVTVRGGARLEPPARLVVDGSASSHPVSALLMAAPCLPAGIEIDVAPGLVSRPYVDLTIREMERAGATVERLVDDRFRVGPGGYRSRDATFIEPDWSSVAYLLAAGPASGGSVSVSPLDPVSIQADARIGELLVALGADAEWTRERNLEEASRRVDADPAACNQMASTSGRIDRPVDVDLSDSPDLAPLVGALACLVPGTSRVRGAAHLRLKETDRIATVCEAARALGCEATEHDDGFEIDGGTARPGVIDPHGDHRIAMAFAVACLGAGGGTILDPGCVRKSYPGFWRDLSSLIGQAIPGAPE